MQAGEHVEFGSQAVDDDIRPIKNNTAVQPIPILGVSEAGADGRIKQVADKAADINQNKAQHKPLVKRPPQPAVINQKSHQPSEKAEVKKAKEVSEMGVARESMVKEAVTPPEQVQVQGLKAGVILLGMNRRH